MAQRRSRDVPLLVDKLADTADGPKAAAWLCWRHKGQIRCSGYFSVAGKSGEFPPWFQVAVECLKRRQGWSVVKRVTAASTTYRVEWGKWGTWARAR
jgi:hypothetical protein